MNSGSKPQLERALRPVPSYERAVREVSKMFATAGIRQALVGALGANAYRNRPRFIDTVSTPSGEMTIAFRYELEEAGRRLRATERLRAPDREQDNIWVFERGA